MLKNIPFDLETMRNLLSNPRGGSLALETGVTCKMIKKTSKKLKKNLQALPKNCFNLWY